jgi:hypothetical protein
MNITVLKATKAIPRGPGLGVELYPELVAKAADRYQREGEFPSRLAHDRVDVTVTPKL